MIPRDINWMRVRIKGAANQAEGLASRADRDDGRRSKRALASNESGRVALLITISSVDKINVINAYEYELREYYRVAVSRCALIIRASKLG